MISYSNIPLVGTGIFVLLSLILVIYLLRNISQEKREEMNFNKQLKHNLNPTETIIEEPSKLQKFLDNYTENLVKAGITEPGSTNKELQNKLLLIGGIIFTITLFVTKSVVGGLLSPSLLYFGLGAWAKFAIDKRKNLVDEQIPAFVSTFKANIQAKQHPQNAMMSAIKNTATPLYDELVYPLAIMEAGDFRPGIVALRYSTDNETLRQMASCIELASSSGSNMLEQIEIIEDIIEDKQEIARKKRLGVNENKILFIVAAAIVPLTFIGTYLMSEMHQEFWFDSTLSWIILIGLVIGMIVSSIATWKIIESIDIG